mmetsp:Transcript_47752/g.153760  ORF Transcript_47752/g.153760 Transcript_47752/m.153760 type:complete len:734 (+) Transcript_47752:239-2440(+)
MISPKCNSADFETPPDLLIPGFATDEDSGADGDEASVDLLTPTSRLGRRTACIKNKQASARLASRSKALLEFRSFLLERNGPMLRTWFSFFDKTQAARIGHKEFRTGLSSLRYNGDIDGMWTDINHDNSDELFFDEVDAEQGKLWTKFRRWCGSHFEGPRDMFRELKRAAAAASEMQEQRSAPPGQQMRAPQDILAEQEVYLALDALGWTGGDEPTIFAIMDLSCEGGIYSRDLKWMDVEVRRNLMKENASKHAMKMSAQKAKHMKMCAVALNDFKLMLRRQYGPLFRAWRRVLDQDGSMTLQRAELFKVCRQINWTGNMRTLWKALDNDGSGATTFEELDPHGARLLSEFRSWALGIWGTKMSAPLFKELDNHNKRKLSYKEFAQGCDRGGFPMQRAHVVATHLDWRAAKCIQEDDLSVLDIWRPPDWLIALPNESAAEEFKACLLKKYGHFVRAWRQAMDKDNTNRCSWYEFTHAAKRIKFTGDVPGAWVVFDTDLSGIISLRAIDPVSSTHFMDFKRWVDQEFGGCRYAFKAMDPHKTNSLNFREFRSACRSYGYQGDITSLFASLDQHGNKHVLILDEVAFLDDWDTDDGPGNLSPDDLEVLRSTPEAAASGARDAKAAPKTTLFVTPGPGAYDFNSSFAPAPGTACARHGGAFSMGARLQPLWTKPHVGPLDYRPNDGSISARPRKPAWAFGDARGPPPQVLHIPHLASHRGSPAAAVQAAMAGIAKT